MGGSMCRLAVPESGREECTVRRAASLTAACCMDLSVWLHMLLCACPWCVSVVRAIGVR